jgi:tetratricopeptide (TPR) repeat protein
MNTIGAKRFVQVVVILVGLIGSTMPACVRAQGMLRGLEAVNEALADGRNAEAEQMLERIVNTDERNGRAHVLLMFIRMRQGRHDEAFRSFRKAYEVSPHRLAFLYAMMNSPMFMGRESILRPAPREFLIQCLKESDSTGVVHANIHQKLGWACRMTNQPDEAARHFAAVNSITDWAAIGPFENLSNSGYHKTYGPEKSVDLSARYTGRSGTSVTWFVPKHFRPDNWFDVTRHFPNRRGVYYMYCAVYSPKNQDVSLRVGTSGAFKAFLNDAQVLECEEESNNGADTYICATRLRSGWNKVLMKLCVDELDRCDFMMRICLTDGTKLPGLRTSTDMQAYVPSPDAVSQRIDDVFVGVFARQAELHPEYPENILLLSTVLERRGAPDRAESVISAALKSTPRSTLFLNKLTDRFIAFNRSDRQTELIARIAKIDSSDLRAIMFRYYDALRNKNFEEAERLLKVYAETEPDAEEVWDVRIELYQLQELRTEYIDAITAANERFPGNYRFAELASAVAVSVLRDLDKAAKIWLALTKAWASPRAYMNLANVHAFKGDTRSWRKYVDMVAGITNDDPEILFSIAKVCEDLGENDEAERLLLICIEACPGYSGYYERLGDIRRKGQSTLEATKLYRKALLIDPENQPLREKIRDLEKRRDPMSVFAVNAIDSLIAHAPSAAQFPEDDSYIVLQDDRYVVYPEGPVDFRGETLVRILKPEGIDDWKELNLGPQVTIEKAVTIRQDMSEVRADEDDGQLVFTTLHEGDYIHVRWRRQYTDEDRFSKDFSARTMMRYRQPAGRLRLSVLVPKDYSVRSLVHGVDVRSESRVGEEGTVFEWNAENRPALRYEAMSPNPLSVCEYVELSSIRSWNEIARWYLDVTNNRAKVTDDIREKAAQLMPSRADLSDDEKIRRVYGFITDSIRYSFVPFRQSGCTPQRASDVLRTRIGDCKDVSTLAIALLSASGMTAEYCLVRTNSETMRKPLPSRDFDHVIVRVKSLVGYRYIDCTMRNLPLGGIPASDMDALVLHVNPETNDIDTLKRSMFSSNHIESVLRIDYSSGGDATVDKRDTYHAAVGAQVRYDFRDKSRSENERRIREALSSDFRNVRINGFGFENLDSLDARFGVGVSFVAPDYLVEAGSFRLMKLPWAYTLPYDEAFSYETRENPIEGYLPYDSVSERLEITLPAGYRVLEIPQDVSLRSPLGTYTARYSMNDSVFIAQRIYAPQCTMIAPKDYIRTKDWYHAVTKEDERQVILFAGAPDSIPVPGPKK